MVYICYGGDGGDGVDGGDRDEGGDGGEVIDCIVDCYS